jgi:murein L,D-transpeptidase YafK
VLAVVIAVAGAFGIGLGGQTNLIGLLSERQAITWTRWTYRAMRELGFALPGTPDLTLLDKRLATAGVRRGNAVAIRIHKADFSLELWVLKGERFHLFAAYPICAWSGRIGPKLVEGDRQSPEGFYTVDAGALNPQSRWHRSFNLGFPNAFDRAHGRTGSYLMVHGGCSSIGCYAITDEAIDEVWQLVTAALEAGQKRIPVTVLPFRMTASALAGHAGDPRADFWAQLAAGDALFEATGQPPRVRVCRGRYTVAAAGGPADWQAAIVEDCRGGG